MNKSTNIFWFTAALGFIVSLKIIYNFITGQKPSTFEVIVLSVILLCAILLNFYAVWIDKKNKVVEEVEEDEDEPKEE